MKAKKTLGQNFLKSKKFLNEIIKAGNLSANDFVLEIGPGKGSLTEKILESGAKVLAIEKDRRLIDFLKEKFEKEISSDRFKIIEGDILDFDISNLPKYKLIANIPYYITGQIIEKFLENNNQPELAVLLVQKEVADRIVARDNKESILSNAIKIYCQPKYICKVPARFFSPAPKVDSAIILFEKITKDNFIKNQINEKNFFEILKAGFSHKRKVLISNLRKTIKNDTKNIDVVFEKLNIDPKIRAENLKICDWINISKEIQN